jgi:hypothetical protein
LITLYKIKLAHKMFIKQQILLTTWLALWGRVNLEEQLARKHHLFNETYIFVYGVHETSTLVPTLLYTKSVQTLSSLVLLLLPLAVRPCVGLGGLNGLPPPKMSTEICDFISLRFRDSDVFLRGGVVSTTPNPQPGGPRSPF